MNDIIFPVINEQNFITKKQPAARRDSESTQNRKTRFDKTSTMKFPVTDQEHAQFRNLWLIYRHDWKEIWIRDHKRAEDISITVFLTMLLRFGLRHLEIMNEHISYRNTKIHKTVKPNQYEKELISGINGLTVEWQLTSDRKTLHRIMLSVLQYLRHGGTLNYEEIQPIRPY